MKSRTIVLVPLVVGLGMVMFLIYGVRAQSGMPGSADAGQAPAVMAVQVEAAPDTAAQPGATGKEWSTSDGQAPSAPVPPLKEFAPGFNLDGSSQSPSAVQWNTSIRFVGSTLRPRQSGVGYATNGNGSCVYVTSGSATTVWNLPLALPSGAKVQYVRMYYYDNDTGVNSNGWFTKYDLYGGLVDEWAVDSANGGNGYRDALITPTEVINYDSYSYVLNWRPTAITNTLQLCGFRIFYEVTNTTYLPMMHK